MNQIQEPEGVDTVCDTNQYVNIYIYVYVCIRFYLDPSVFNAWKFVTSKTVWWHPGTLLSGRIHQLILLSSHVQPQELKLGVGYFSNVETQILIGIQFTRHFIEFVFVEMRQSVGSNSNVILTRQTCGQRSSMVAGSKHRTLSFYFPLRMRYIFPITRCKREWNLGLWTFLVLDKRMRETQCHLPMNFTAKNVCISEVGPAQPHPFSTYC